MANIQHNAVDVRGLYTHYRRAGKPEDETIVFLGGWGAPLTGPNGSDRVIRELAKHFYVISPEAPGLLRSQPPKEVWGFPEYAAHLHALLQSLNIKKPIIMGHSFGGGMGLMYSYLYPENVDRLVLVNAAIKGERRERYYKLASVVQFVSPVILFPLIPLSFARWVLHLINGVPKHIVTKENLRDYWVMPHVPPAYIKSVELVEYSKVSTPTLLIWGKKDTITPFHWAETAHSQLPNAELITLDGVHGVLYKDPKKVVNIIADQLSR